MRKAHKRASPGRPPRLACTRNVGNLCQPLSPSVNSEAATHLCSAPSLPDSPVLSPFFLLIFLLEPFACWKDQKLHHRAAKGIPSLLSFFHSTVTRDLGLELHSGVWSHPRCHARRWLTTQIVLPWPWLEPCSVLSGQKLASCPPPPPSPQPSSASDSEGTPPTTHFSFAHQKRMDPLPTQ